MGRLTIYRLRKVFSLPTVPCVSGVVAPRVAKRTKKKHGATKRSEPIELNRSNRIRQKGVGVKVEDAGGIVRVSIHANPEIRTNEQTESAKSSGKK